MQYIWAKISPASSFFPFLHLLVHFSMIALLPTKQDLTTILRTYARRDMYARGICNFTISFLESRDIVENSVNSLSVRLFEKAEKKRKGFLKVQS